MSKWDAPYVPSTWDWVSNQVEEFEASGGAKGNTLMDTGLPILVMWTIGQKSGALRKVPLMRVEHEGEYAIVASKGGAPQHPAWYYNLVADNEIRIQDGPEVLDYTLDRLDGEERQMWWDRSVAAYPPYAEYAVSAADANREIPVFVARPVV